MELTRRHCLCGLGALAAGSALLASPGDSLSAATRGHMQRFDQLGGPFGWTPHKLEPAESAAVAYDGFWYKGYACGYGVFYSLIGLMAEKHGAPYNTFPFSMLAVNEGGLIGWGTLCGALYGAAAAYALFWERSECAPLVNELFGWYETAALPMYQPGEKAQGKKGELSTTVSSSVLCHISVSKWCFANKVESCSLDLYERCARLTADVAKKACEILNAKIDQGKAFRGAFVQQQSVATCAPCHQTQGAPTNWANGHMDCTPCHDGGKALHNKFVNHP